jgi:hypothetical protein
VVLVGNSETIYRPLELIRSFVLPVAVITRPDNTVENIDMLSRRTQQDTNFNIVDDRDDKYGEINNVIIDL